MLHSPREGSVLVRLGTVSIVGVGLIGGSIGLALRSRGLASKVVGVGRDARTLEQARSRGVIDEATTDLASGVAEAEVVVVCTPVSRIPQDVRRVAEAAPASALVTDAGSTKRQIVEAIERHPASACAFRRGPSAGGIGKDGVGPCPTGPLRGPGLRPDPDLPDLPGTA